MGQAKINHRNLRFGQAVLLGVEFERRYINAYGVSVKSEYAKPKWYLALPPDKHFGGYVSGPFKWRWEAVESSLKHLGV